MVKSLSKGIIEGEQVCLIGHLVKSEQHMGRSLIIDLQGSAEHRFKQVDHRTIESIIIKNVKFNLGKKSTLNTLEGWKWSETEKWNQTKLEVGNWFSEMQYYKLTNNSSDSRWDAEIYSKSRETYEIPKNQVEDMWSANMFDTEEKITRTEMIEILINAKECVFTVTFRKKITATDIQDLLSGVTTQKKLKSEAKTLSK